MQPRTYPGVYVEEIPSSTRTIAAVTTSVTAFVGHTRRGPLDTPVKVASFAEFERRFGGLGHDSAVGYAVHQYFAGGGADAVIVRVVKANSCDTAHVTLESTEGRSAEPVLKLRAREPGHWGNHLRVAVDHDTPCPDETFNLTVHDTRGGRHEHFHDLSMDRHHHHNVEDVIRERSRLIRAETLGEHRPDPSGTVSKPFGHPLPDLDVDITVKIGEVEREFHLYDPSCDGHPPHRVRELAHLLERKLRAQRDLPGKHAFARAEVTAFGHKLQVTAGSLDPEDTVRFLGECANDLGLEASVNPPAFAFTGGDDGEAPGPDDLIGSEAAKTGIQALRGAADVNLLTLPELAGYADIDDVLAVLSAAQRLCAERRIFLLADAPAAWCSVDDARAGIAAFAPVRHDHTALYFPHIEAVDPVTGRVRAFPPGGAVAGTIARTDAERGVWKAPAGTEAKLAGAVGLSVPLTDQENGLLNPLGLNCLRTRPLAGQVVWGARTLAPLDQEGDTWRYVPVRRLALHIEESLYRGLQWVVFEPNDEQLWQQIRLNAGAYLQTLFLQGAFKGKVPREAYFVKCDSETTTAEDIANGVVNVVVGIAPQRPAEFVVVKIQQSAGQFEL
ncbi:phage tail sheath family protein [Streptomyces boninensis]|uniref:phage tail sheath family protein n=1 Tax=Streptomyces boninensis TaxID=2039455 RepID=UPI003B227D52